MQTHSIVISVLCTSIFLLIEEVVLLITTIDTSITFHKIPTKSQHVSIDANDVQIALFRTWIETIVVRFALNHIPKGSNHIPLEANGTWFSCIVVPKALKEIQKEVSYEPTASSRSWFASNVVPITSFCTWLELIGILHNIALPNLVNNQAYTSLNHAIY